MTERRVWLDPGVRAAGARENREPSAKDREWSLQKEGRLFVLAFPISLNPLPISRFVSCFDRSSAVPRRAGGPSPCRAHLRRSRSVPTTSMAEFCPLSKLRVLTL